MRILGEKVRQFRKRKGMSQKELADGICTQATRKKVKFQV